jgi:preprotein translocase subunit SecD
MNSKNLKAPFKALVIIAVCAISLWAVIPVQKTIRLGLDLQGGARLLLQLYPTASVPQITSQVQAQTREVIDRRINGLGVAEPSISNVGTDRILVELPAVKDPDQAEKVLKQVAVLEYKIVPFDVMQKADAATAALLEPNLDPKQKAAAELYVSKTAYDDSGKVVYSGAELKAAQAGYDQGGKPDILFQTKDPAKFGKLTSANIQKPLGIFLDHRYLSAPIINSPIYDSGQITGTFTQEATITLANELNAGALPVSVKIIEKESIGPTLGKIDLVQSMRAAALGLGLVLIFMVGVYRLPGLLADLALAIYVLVMMAILALSHATRHRRLRALDRHGSRRQRTDLRAHQGRTVERQDDARRGPRRIPTRLFRGLR